MQKPFVALCLFACFLTYNCKQNTSKTESQPLNSSTSKANEAVKSKDNEYLIQGTVFNANNATIYLFKNGKSTTIVDSTQVKNNRFYFKGTAKTPHLYSISKNKQTTGFPLLVDNSKIAVFLNDRLDRSVSFSNSAVQKDYLLYQTKLITFKDRGLNLYYDLKGDFSTPNIRKLKQKRSKLFSEQNRYTALFIKEHPNSYYAAMLLNQHIDAFPPETLRTLYKGLSNTVKKATLAQTLNTLIIEKEKNKLTKPTVAKVKPAIKKIEEYRAPAYAIRGNNQYNAPISLNAYKGKVVLIDFWASWCGPCRATNPSLVILHKKYAKKGLVILSISEDKGEPEWQQAISTDNLNWDSHIIDKNKSIAFRYGVESIPFKLLVDRKGRIASEKISGNSLESRIIQLLNEK